MRARSDKGFTLVELLLAVVIVGVITVPLTRVVISYFRNTDETTARLNESRDAQIAAAYFGRDVASIGARSATGTLNQSVELDAAYNGGLYPCGSPGTPPALVRLAWDDYPTGATTAIVVRVAYVVETVSGQTQLHRIRCNGASTPASDTMVAHDLDPTKLPSVSCSTTCTSGAPATVALTLTMKDPKNRRLAYAVTLTGQRRQSS